MYELERPGWFRSLNGLKVIHHEVSSRIVGDATTWARGAPRRLTFHFQAGCGADLEPVQEARGYPFIAFNVDQEGQWRQYLDARMAAWHLHDASRYSIGVEHAADLEGGGGCDLNDKQLAASNQGQAAIIEWIEDAYGVAVPLRHASDCSRYREVLGLDEHDDYLPCPELNPTRHVDRLYGWGWDKWLAGLASWAEKPNPAPAFPGVLLRAGTDHPAVIRWKRRMSVKHLFTGPNDGPRFGPAAVRATKSFQARRGLTVDGVVGPHTWAEAWRRA